MTGTRLIPRPYRDAPGNVPDGVRAGPWVADVQDDEIVVFLIGMQVHRWRRVRSWRPMVRWMRAMITELQADPDSGLLGTHRLHMGRVFVQLQYWRRVEDLGRFAHDPDRTHLPAWASFNREIAGSGDIGVFHETYRIRADAIESLYANIKAYGLLAAHGAKARHELRRNATHERMESVEAEYVSAP